MTQTQEKFDTKPAAQTGVVPTFMVAVEQSFSSEQRVIHDDLALKIMPSLYQWLIKLFQKPALRDWLINISEKQAAGIWSAMMCRKRYIDDKVVVAVSDGQVASIVNLGAGFDTRLYRLPALSAVPVWEVDQPGNIKSKGKGVKKALEAIPAHVTLVPINFMEQDVSDVLRTQGYAGDNKTFFIWEAVSQYLTEAAVRRTFEFLSKAPAGSQLTFTYVRKDFIEGKNLYGLEKFYTEVIIKNKQWLFGFDPEEVDNFLSEYGWRFMEHLGYDELAERYMKPTGRELPSMMIERMVYATKM
ncbi:MAG TPA: SAM-dependent methyltransferase [Arenicellales bacterium]|jgi:methyltransferase (TIGR00027 family)|nr:SAM-dependent methyltransferase [Gammaproteobacteria bacterium]MBP18455.1 SAM-dependent methyltransferase [Gammaproteobacteria bacterium]MDP6315380.1 SAM-dependent methyltransferase [Pseudomonadales bacterium]HJL53539.1 SAM-dependent methyltransferase [Arenicellales bacterium]HJP50517.1 SAM-dependent methyltransferase [Pseudomonadales bacterium]|tara:strand:+ start:394 stop:1293 length:900 start_codon:yes stop_codon:yes gene_type:complete